MVHIRVILGILSSFVPDFASCGPNDTMKSAHVHVFNISRDSRDEQVRERDVIPAGTDPDPEIPAGTEL